MRKPKLASRARATGPDHHRRGRTADVLAEPVAVGMHAAEQVDVDVDINVKVVVFDCGPIGLVVGGVLHSTALKVD